MVRRFLTARPLNSFALRQSWGFGAERSLGLSSSFYWIALGKWLHFFEPPFLYSLNGANDNILLVMSL